MHNKNKWFSFLYRTRVKLHKGQTPIINLSLVFMLLALMSAPWLAVGGGIAALALGYRFSIERESPDFTGDWDEVVQGAAENVKSAVDGLHSHTDDQE